MTDFSIIYEDILDITKNDDLTFTNLETPVVDYLDYENYPYFNVKEDFALAAINGGFDVFSLANNHSVDQGLEGLKATRDFFKKQKEKDVYACGIKDDYNEPYTYQLIEKNGFKILFMALTEIINIPKYYSWFDFVGSSDKNRDIFLDKLTEMRKEHPCDIFILSMHSLEPEYVMEVTKRRINYFHDILDAGVDIVWANHPHVTQEWEIVKDKNNPFKNKYIFYCIGNTLSGQRYRRNYRDTDFSREYTGDSILAQIKFTKCNKIVYGGNPEITYITNHTDYNTGNTYIKKLNEEFINTTSSRDQKYYSRRLELMKEIKGKTIWQ